MIDSSADFVTKALRSTGVIDGDTSVAKVENDRMGEGVGLNVVAMFEISHPVGTRRASRRSMRWKCG